MTTKINETETQPQVLMDNIHIESFTFTQPLIDNPKRKIAMAFSRYGIDPEGNRVFSKESTGLLDDDMDSTVVTAALTSGQTIEQFTAEYIAEKTAVATEYAQGGITDTKLMAYFELAMARVAELNGKLTIASVE